MRSGRDDDDDNHENENAKARTTLFFYDGWRTIEEQDADGTTEATYVQGPMYIDEHITMDRRLGRGSHNGHEDDEEEDNDGEGHGKTKSRRHAKDDDGGKGGEKGDNRPFKRFFYHQNSIFNVMGLTNEAGALVERVSYDIYGAPTFGSEARFQDKDKEEGRSQKSAKGNPFLFERRPTYRGPSRASFFRSWRFHVRVQGGSGKSSLHQGQIAC